MINKNIDGEAYEEIGGLDHNIEKSVWKHKVSKDVGTLVATALWKLLPLSYERNKNKHNKIPTRINKGQIVSTAISLAIPTIKVIDDIILKGKLQEKFDSKSPVKIDHLQNLVNVVQAYPSTHDILKSFSDNTILKRRGQPPTVVPLEVKADAILGAINIITPHLADRFTDPNLTVSEKIYSFVPFPFIGTFVRGFMKNNPKLQKVYNMGEGLLDVARHGSDVLSNITDPNTKVGSTAANTSNVIRTIQSAVGMNNRGGFGNRRSVFGPTYENDYTFNHRGYSNSWNNDQRWRGF
jgi:hypothetical protein